MNQELQIRLHKFDKMNTDSNVLIIGPDENKKTSIVKNILQAKQDDITKIVVFSDKPEYDQLQVQIINDYLPKNDQASDCDIDAVDASDSSDKDKNIGYYFKIFDQFDNDVLEKLSDCDCVILDIKQNEIVPENIFSKDRLCIVCTTQYNTLTESTRQSLNYMFMLDKLENRRKLWIECCGIIQKFKVFSKLLDICTRNDEFFLINNNGDSNKAEDHIFWGKCEFVQDVYEDSSLDESAEKSNETQGTQVDTTVDATVVGTTENNTQTLGQQQTVDKKRDDTCVIL